MVKSNNSRTRKKIRLDELVMLSNVEKTMPLPRDAALRFAWKSLFICVMTTGCAYFPNASDNKSNASPIAGFSGQKLRLMIAIFSFGSAVFNIFSKPLYLHSQYNYELYEPLYPTH